MSQYAQPAIIGEILLIRLSSGFWPGDQNAKALYPSGLELEVCVVPCMHLHIINDQPPTCLAGDVAGRSMSCEYNFCVMWSLHVFSSLKRIGC